MGGTKDNGEGSQKPTREQMEAEINGAFQLAPRYTQETILKAIKSRGWEDTPRLRDLLAYEARCTGW